MFLLKELNESEFCAGEALPPQAHAEHIRVLDALRHAVESVEPARSIRANCPAHHWEMDFEGSHLVVEGPTRSGRRLTPEQAEAFEARWFTDVWPGWLVRLAREWGWKDE